MFDVKKVGSDNIEEFAELRSAVLMEINGLSEPAEKQNFMDENLAFLKQSIPSGKFIAFMAFDGDKIVSACAASLFSIAPCKSVPNGKVGCIQNMYTFKEYRRQGIASILLEKTIEEAKEKGCSKITLNVTKMGRPLYEKFGFTESKDEMEMLI